MTWVMTVQPETITLDELTLIDQVVEITNKLSEPAGQFLGMLDDPQVMLDYVITAFKSVWVFIPLSIREKFVQDALDQDIITASKAAEILGVPITKIRGDN